MAVASQPSKTKSATFQMRISPEVKQQAEKLFATYGLTLTDAVNIFIQQSLNTNGLLFLLSPKNAEYMKARAMHQFVADAEKGWQSAEAEGWVSLDEAEAQLGVSHNKVRLTPKVVRGLTEIKRYILKEIDTPIAAQLAAGNNTSTL